MLTNVKNSDEVGDHCLALIKWSILVYLAVSFLHFVWFTLGATATCHNSINNDSIATLHCESYETTELNKTNPNRSKAWRAIAWPKEYIQNPEKRAVDADKSDEIVYDPISENPLNEINLSVDQAHTSAIISRMLLFLSTNWEVDQFTIHFSAEEGIEPKHEIWLSFVILEFAWDYFSNEKENIVANEFNRLVCNFLLVNDFAADVITLEEQGYRFYVVLVSRERNQSMTYALPPCHIAYSHHNEISVDVANK